MGKETERALELVEVGYCSGALQARLLMADLLLREALIDLRWFEMDAQPVVDLLRVLPTLRADAIRASRNAFIASEE